MTFASALFGGGGAAPYRSGNFYPAIYLDNPDGATVTADRDYLIPLIVRKAVSVNKVGYARAASTAGNVYVGIYDSAGTLLTDCAVDADTTFGLHAVSTSPVTLLPSQQYWICANASAAVVHGDSPTYPDVSTFLSASLSGFAIGMGASGFYTTPTNVSFGLYKERTNAALLSSLTMTGWTQDVFCFYGGIVAA